MNILFINKKNPFLDGGAEKRILHLSKYLVENGHNVSILFSKTKHDDKTCEKHGINLHCESYFPNLFLNYNFFSFYLSKILFYLLPSMKLKKIINNQEIDTVIIDISPSYNIFNVLYLENQKLNRYYTIHETFGSLFNWMKYYGILGLWGYITEKRIRKNSRKYNKIITVAEWVKNSLEKNIDKDKIIVIPNGVEVNKFRKSPQYQKKTNITNLLNVGRFVKHKNHKMLINSIEILNKKIPCISLCLVGKGPLLMESKNLVKQLDLEDKIHFHEYVSNEKLLEIYENSDIFLLSSNYEGQPIVIQEAMSMGLPIVSTKIPAVYGMLDESNSILCQPNDANDMAEKAYNLINNRELREKLSENVRKEAVLKYDWNIIAQQFSIALNLEEA